MIWTCPEDLPFLWPFTASCTSWIDIYILLSFQSFLFMFNNSVKCSAHCPITSPFTPITFPILSLLYWFWAVILLLSIWWLDIICIAIIWFLSTYSVSFTVLYLFPLDHYQFTYIISSSLYHWYHFSFLVCFISPTVYIVDTSMTFFISDHHLSKMTHSQ